LALPFLTLFGGLLLALSVLLEGELPSLPAAVDATWPTSVAGLSLTPGPSTEVATPAPEPAGTPSPSAQGTPAAPPLGAGDLNVLLLGSDRRPGVGDPSWRTDTVIVVAIRREARTAAMLSIPRDLWVSIPGNGQNRINVADYLGERLYGPGGGPTLLAATLQQNLGIPVHAYARVDFAGLIRIIDALGGVTITSDRAFDEWIDGSDRAERWHLSVAVGTQRMDGRTALGYARSRTGTSDLDRGRRQQQILLAIRDVAMRPAVLPQVPSLLTALWDTVDTDLTPERVLSLLPLAQEIDPAAYRCRVFDRSMVRDWVAPGGAMVLLPDRACIEQVWAELTAPPR